MLKKVKTIIKNILIFIMTNRVISDIACKLIILKYKKINNSVEKGKVAINPWVCDFKFNVEYGKIKRVPKLKVN